MNIYVATAFGNRENASMAMHRLRAEGHTITHDWTHEAGDDPEFLRRCAEADIRGVYSCDALIVLAHSEARSTWFEMGLAYANTKRILVIGPTKFCIFCNLNGIETFDDLNEAIVALRADK